MEADDDQDARYRADFEQSRSSLPIFKYKDDIVGAVADFPVLIVVGDTGSGKTTQLPQYIYEANPALRVVITQPRRIAAISAATRVSEEMGTSLGSAVGYQIRFESNKSDSTKLLYMTDGTLLRSTVSDPTLSNLADIVVLDEAHERSLDTDVLFGVLKAAVQKRPDLKVIVMSATLDVDKFSNFFGEAPVFTVPGRMYPVEVLYARKMKMAALKGQIVPKAVEAVIQIHKSEEPGDILVFLTGQYEIELACRLISQEADKLHSSEIFHRDTVKHLSIHPIYSALDTPDQKAVFSPAKKGYRKVVVATNIAQTSITIPGIRYVVDSGFVKETLFDPSIGVDALLVVPVSQAAATQRAGRAGRTAPGKVYRLYSREAFESMDQNTVPEIQRSSLLGTVLTLKTMGITNVLEFDFIDPPDRQQLISALKHLYYLGALDDKGNLTSLGTLMSNIPTSPYLSRALISACQENSCGADMLTLIALLTSEAPFQSPRNETQRAHAELAHANFADSTGDHIALLHIFDGFISSSHSSAWCRSRYLKYRALSSALHIRRQLEEVAKRHSLQLLTTRTPSKPEIYRLRKDEDWDDVHDAKGRYDAAKILKSLCTGFFINTAKRHPSRPFFYHYLGASGAAGDDNDASRNALMSLHLQPDSCLAERANDSRGDIEWIIYQDVQFVTRALMRVASRIQFSWVEKGLERVKTCPVESVVGLPKEVPKGSAGKRRRSSAASGTDGGADVRGSAPKKEKSIDVVESEQKKEQEAAADEKRAQEDLAEKERLARIEAAKARYQARSKKR